MIERWIDRLASLRLAVVCLGALIVLVFWGTLYQVEHGIWQAQQAFFRSWFVMAGPVPLFPGGKLVLGLLFVNLLTSLLFRMEVSWRKAGLTLTHLGLLLMLAGGYVTYRLGEESFLSLVEGEGSNVSLSYRDWELSLWTEQANPLRVTAYDSASFKPGLTWNVSQPGVQIMVEQYLQNCRPGAESLEPLPLGPQPEEYMPGAVLRVRRGDREERVVLFGGESAPQEFSDKDGSVFLALRRKRHPLPMAVTLHKFTREYYPGSDIPKTFSSLIEVDNRGLQRTALIAMNEPFRFRDFTFYQASFANLQDGSNLSTLAVTRNVGRLLPYVATALTVVGLILHFLVELLRRRGPRKAAT